MVVNWGSSRAPAWLAPNVRIVNSPTSVGVAANKLLTFQRFKEAGFEQIPEWTTDREVAEGWCCDGGMVVCRTVLNGHSGRGIIVADLPEQVINAPLYVKYVKKLKEFRVHVAFNNVIDVQEKRRRNDVGADADSRIRNHHTGWVYCREEISEPENLRETAISAVAALGLDFGAVDLIYNQKKNQILVLEVNTACGLEGTTLQNYVSLIVEKANENRQ